MFDVPLSELPFISGTLAVDVVRLAEQHGIPVVQHCFTDEIDGALIPVLGVDTIVINAEHCLVRRRFTLAHELAHYTKHRRADRRYLCSLKGGFYASDPIEREANYLAGCLLMPSDIVMSVTSQTEWSVGGLASMFVVSYAACEIRLRELGLK